MKRNARSGLTMLELIAALAVLTIGLMGAVAMYYVGLDNLKANEENRAAVTALRNEIEYQRSLPFEQLADVTNAPFHSTAGLEDMVNVQTAVTVSPVADTPGLKEVAATVRWTGQHGRTITKRLAALVAEKGGA